jgi:hypothetical protein
MVLSCDKKFKTSVPIKKIVKTLVFKIWKLTPRYIITCTQLTYKEKKCDFFQYFCHALSLTGLTGVHLMLLVPDSVSDTWQDHLLMVEKNVQILSKLAKVWTRLCIIFVQMFWIFYHKKSSGIKTMVVYKHFQKYFSYISWLSVLLVWDIKIHDN